MTTDHEAWRDLIAVHSLDALDDHEAAEVEDHLRDCPKCREELKAYRETAAVLAYAGTDAPEGLWDRIAQGIESHPDEPRPPLELIVGGRRTETSAASRPTWVWRAAAAAAVVVIAGTGAEIVHQDHRINQLSTAVADQSLLRQATAAALDPTAKHLALISPTGAVQATAAVLPDGDGYVVDAAMARLPSDKTYQLWTITGDRATSAGVMGPNPSVVRFHLAPGTDSVAVTEEPSGGSAQPTSAPVAYSTV